MNIYGITAWHLGVRVNDDTPVKSVYLYDRQLRMKAQVAVSAPVLRFRHLLMVLDYRILTWLLAPLWNWCYRLWWTNKRVIGLRWKWTSALAWLKRKR